MKILLVTPPMTQLNTPYPATAYLTGFLKSRGYQARQGDLALDLVLRIFSRAGLTRILSFMKGRGLSRSSRSVIGEHFLAHADQYILTIDRTIAFLQGKDPTLAFRIAHREFLPEGPRFNQIPAACDGGDSLDWAFGGLGLQDKAKYFASLYIDDLADLVTEEVDSQFGLSKYGEKLAASVPSFDAMQEALAAEPTLIGTFLDEATDDLLAQEVPDFVGITAPFPGNVFGAFRIAQRIRRTHPGIFLALGGGYVNTELRELEDPRVFDYFNAITLDDGEQPLLSLLERLKKKSGPLLRTFVRSENQVSFESTRTLHDIPHRSIGTPTYEGLRTDRYLSLLEMLNPMHRIWSDGRWNKLTLAHGCYWKKCNFCDISLDYIGRYDPVAVDVTLDRMQALINETGQTGFHFVDEAAPPALLKSLAQGILAREMSVTWWGNVRFDKVFTPELAGLLARSGCIAVSGGLEVASDRLLKLMQKGVTVEQVARVTHSFTQAGIMVHAYLMYGFPTQTEQETIDSLERVRQLFEAGCMQSAFWHRFSATAHSPVGLHPGKFGIKILGPPKGGFARNDLEFSDPTGADHDWLGEGLRIALYNYMQGTGLDLDVRSWFRKTKRSRSLQISVPKNLVQKALSQS